MLALAIALNATGCARPAAIIIPPAETLTLGSAGLPADPDFAPGAAILDGLDLAPAPEDWQIGDTVLLGIRLRKPTGQTVRFLRIELTGDLDTENRTEFVASPKGRPKYKFSSAEAFTRLTLYDRDGRQITRALGRFPEKLLGCGLYNGVEASMDRPDLRDKPDLLDSLPPDAYDRSIRGWLTMFSFSGSMGRKGMFRDMLFDIIARPTWLAMLLNPSISLGFGEDWPTRSGPWTAPGSPASLETVSVPLLCEIAGKKAAAARVLASKPLAPLSLCGGILHLDAHNADNPAVHLDVRLLAARRGSGGQKFTPTSGSTGLAPEP
jgi:hypothetical protein